LIGEMNIQFATNVVLMFLFLCGSKLSEDGILASTNMADVVNLGLLP